MVLIIGLLLVWYGIIYLWYGHQGAPDVVEASVKSHLVEDFLCHPAQRKLSIWTRYNWVLVFTPLGRQDDRCA